MNDARPTDQAALMVGMSTFDATAHPRATTGQFTDKRNDAPTGGLTATVELGGHSISHAATTGPGMTQITADEYAAREMVDASQLKAGDVLAWHSIDDTAGTQYWVETVTYAQAGIDEKYRRVVDVETARKPGGDNVIRFRASDRVAVIAAAETPVVYPAELRDGHTPETLAVVVETSDAYGSTVRLQAAGDERGTMLDRFRIAEKLEAGEIPLLESSREVQEKVADRFIPLAGLSMDDYLRREPIRHGGRAWND